MPGVSKAGHGHLPDSRNNAACQQEEAGGLSRTGTVLLNHQCHESREDGN